MTNNCSHLSSLILYKLQLKENVLHFSTIFNIKKPGFFSILFQCLKVSFSTPFLPSFHVFKPLMVLSLKII